MSNEILNEIRAALTDGLQELWNKHLLEAWRKYPYGNMRKCVSDFEQKYRVTYTEIEPLKFVPTRLRNFHWICTVTRFVAAFIPQLNHLLWDSNLSDEELLKRMPKMTYYLTPSDHATNALKQKEIRSTKRAYRAARMNSASVHDLYEAHNGHNWTACKTPNRR